MKITFLVSGSIYSNFSYRPLALARALKSRGHQVSIIAPKADKYNDFKAEAVEMIDGVKILQPFQFTTKRIELNLLPYLFGALYSLLKERPDLIYIYKPTPISIIGLVGRLFNGTQTVADFDDLGSEVMRIEGHPPHQRLLVAWSEQLAKKYAHRLVVASHYLFDLSHDQFPLKPTLIIPNGIEADWLDETLSQSQPKRIVFMGAINRQNILDPLFEVLPDIISLHPTTEVVIIGDGKFLPYFKNKAADLQIGKNITFKGWLPLVAAKAELAFGDIGYCYMPDTITTRAASNMKVPQYMARGTVPLVSQVGDLKAMIEHGQAGYIADPDNTTSLKTTLLTALTDPERLNKAAVARLTASHKFNWSNLAAAFDQWLVGQKNNAIQKIYVVATTTPGNVGGGEIRNYHLIKQLSRQPKTEVEVFAISANPVQEQKEFEQQTGITCHLIPPSGRSIFNIIKAILFHRLPPYMEDFKASGLGETVKAACEQSLPDVIQIEQLHTYYCLRPYLPWLKSQGVKIVFDCHNIEFQAFQDSLKIFSTSKKLVGHYLYPNLKKLEIEAATQADTVLACSPSDVTFFKIYNPRTYLIPNGVKVDDFLPSTEVQEPILIFMGGTGYPPNSDAMKFYLEDIHPQVKSLIPNVKLLAIGVEEPWLKNLNITDSSIQPLGFVKDVRPYLQRALIGICPIRYGSGTRIKIMTYMAAGLPVISTQKGAEGVEYTNGHNIIIVDESAAFAKNIFKLWTDKSYRQEIAINGRNFILKFYDWDLIGKDLVAVYLHLKD